MIQDVPFSSLLFMVVMAILLALGSPARADEQQTIRMRIGGGNLVTHLAGKPPVENLYQALKAVGARSGRMNSYGWRDLDRNLTPHDFDAGMLEAFKNGITPIILFEYSGSYQFLDPPQPIGSYEHWFEVGRVYAKRFGKGGEWAKENGAGDWGVSVFTAINEPDVDATIPREAYRNALAGLADGVHSINESFRIVPGGMGTCNSHGDPSFRGYGPVIADLLNDGRLDGIDFHTYYNVRWYPMERGRDFSAQTCFDRAKAALGITRDINFYATEFNTARTEGWDRDDIQGSLFLTAIWDQLGIQKADGSSATVIAFPWNLGDTVKVDGPAYAMATHANPWKPDVRAKVLKMVVELAGDMKFVQMDGSRSGVFVLEDSKSRLVVLQDRKGWTDREVGSSWTVEAPSWAEAAELWGWDGIRKSQAVTGGALVTFDVPGEETYMLRFLRRQPS